MFGCTQQVVQELQVPEACLPNYVIGFFAEVFCEVQRDRVIQPVAASHVQGVVDQLCTVRGLHFGVIFRIQQFCQRFPDFRLIIHAIVT